MTAPWVQNLLHLITKTYLITQLTSSTLFSFYLWSLASLQWDQINKPLILLFPDRYRNRQACRLWKGKQKCSTWWWPQASTNYLHLCPLLLNPQHYKVQVNCKAEMVWSSVAQTPALQLWKHTLFMYSDTRISTLNDNMKVTFEIMDTTTPSWPCKVLWNTQQLNTNSQELHIVTPGFLKIFPCRWRHTQMLTLVEGIHFLFHFKHLELDREQWTHYSSRGRN